jgi:hypothetical protein
MPKGARQKSPSLPLAIQPAGWRGSVRFSDEPGTGRSQTVPSRRERLGRHPKGDRRDAGLGGRAILEVLGVIPERLIIGVDLRCDEDIAYDAVHGVFK